jgi:hypothetical protein
MPKPEISTGKGANITKQGHTTSGAFGTDPNAKAVFRRGVRELSK